jgi:hypothetical protein
MVLEEATADYLRIVDSGQGPLPLALALLDDPAHLVATRWRTVLRFPGPAADSGAKIRDYFSQWHFYPDNPRRIYLTAGPEIESWGYVGPRDYEGNSQGDFVWQNYLALLADLPNADFALGQMGSRESRLWALRGSNQAVYCGQWEETPQSASRRLEVPFGPGAYAACLDSPLGGAAVFSLTEGLVASCGLPGRSNVQFTLPKTTAPQNAGEAAQVRLLLLGIR